MCSVRIFFAISVLIVEPSHMLSESFSVSGSVVAGAASPAPASADGEAFSAPGVFDEHAAETETNAMSAADARCRIAIVLLVIALPPRYLESPESLILPLRVVWISRDPGGARRCA